MRSLRWPVNTCMPFAVVNVVPKALFADSAAPGVSDALADLFGLPRDAVEPEAPVVKEILGEPTYASLADLPESPDIVDVFRRPELCVEHAREAVAAGARCLTLALSDGIGDHEDDLSVAPRLARHLSSQPSQRPIQRLASPGRPACSPPVCPHRRASPRPWPGR